MTRTHQSGTVRARHGGLSLMTRSKRFFRRTYTTMCLGQGINGR